MISLGVPAAVMARGASHSPSSPRPRRAVGGTQTEPARANPSTCLMPSTVARSRMAVGGVARDRRAPLLIARGRKGMLAELLDDGADGVDGAVETTACPCGSGGAYDDCCGRLHNGGGASEGATPEAIVRARFSAYVKNLPEYIVSSTHPDSKDLKRREDPKEGAAQLLKDATSTMKTVAFQRLSLQKTAVGKGKDEQFVTYEVTYKPAGKKKKGGSKNIAERSRYVKTEAGEWKYMDALPLNANEL